MATVVAEPVPHLSREEIEGRAAEVLRSHGLDGIPVNPVVLANRLGIAVHNAKFTDESLVGLIGKRGDDVTLLVKGSASPLRKGFTIAHELGHYFLHFPEQTEFVDGELNLFLGVAEEGKEAGAERRQEIEANRFATALLMPEPAVRAEWKRLGSLKAMARQFNVSRTAMGIRVARLGLA